MADVRWVRPAQTTARPYRKLTAALLLAAAFLTTAAYRQTHQDNTVAARVTIDRIPAGESDPAYRAPAIPRVTAAQVSALRQIHPYIVRPNGQRADPVNIIFRAGHPDQVLAAVRRVLGWHTIAGGPMSFQIGGAEAATAHQLGFEMGNGGRVHLRIAGATLFNEQGSYVAVAVHRDETVKCGHVGRGFDELRDQVVRAFRAAGYPVTLTLVDNNRSGPHCDGSITPGDGVVAVIDLVG